MADKHKAGVTSYIVADDGSDVIGEVQATPTAYTLLGRLKDLITGIVLATDTKVRHPFGKGSLTTDGVQYCTEVASIGETYTAIETITFYQPTGMTLEQIEFGLTGAIGSSGATDAKKWKWQASDAGANWEDLIAEQSQAAAAAYADVSCSGRFKPTGNFLGTGASFKVRMVVKSGGATDTAKGKTKNSSYIICHYRRT